MGGCSSVNKNKKFAKDSRYEAIKKTSTLKRGETMFGKRGDQSERLMGPESVEGGSQMVEAFFCLSEITNPNYEYKIMIFISNSKDGKYTLLGETEKESGHKIIFNISFIFEYFFEKEQLLKFNIIEEETKKRYEIITTVGKVMGSRGMSLTIPIEDQQKKIADLSIDCKNATQSVTELKINVNCNFKADSGVEEYLELFYIINNFNDGKNWRRVYKSMEKEGQRNIPISLFESKLMIDEVCGSDYDRPILFEIYDVSQGIIGASLVTLNGLKSNSTCPIYEYNIQNSTINVNNDLVFQKVIGEININIIEQKVLRFLDYLKMGMQMNLIVGVDFTCSNGDPNLPDSLHYIKGINPYERAIRSCGSIVAYYDYDQLFPVYGFGGRPPGLNKVNHCFNLNLQSDPNVQGVDNIISIYRNAIMLIKQDGPTYFAPLITTVLNGIKEAMKGPDQVYYVLMILTDGMINDMDATCNVLVECDMYPMSVIIIGIGKADFTNMNILDGDEIPLTNSRGQKTRRDLVQFVEFNKYERDASKLAEEVLKEVPRQVEEYYKLTNSFRLL